MAGKLPSASLHPCLDFLKRAATCPGAEPGDYFDAIAIS
jgi:hypothetical protein